MADMIQGTEPCSDCGMYGNHMAFCKNRDYPFRYRCTCGDWLTVPSQEIRDIGVCPKCQAFTHTVLKAQVAEMYRAQAEQAIQQAPVTCVKYNGQADDLILHALGVQWEVPCEQRIGNQQ